jgi:hypothetical protein
MKRVRLTTTLEAWGEKWKPGRVLEVESEREQTWQVVFPTRDGRPVVGTIIKRDAEEIEI